MSWPATDGCRAGAPTCATGPSTPGCTCCCGRSPPPAESDHGSRRPVSGMHALRGPLRPDAGFSREARGMGVSGDPTAGLVPGAPASPAPDRAVPDPATAAGPYFGDGLAIGPDLEGAAEVALAQALAPLDGAAPDLVCVFVAAGVPARAGLVEAAARQVMTASGAH